jgi:hypothetical protein
MQKNSSIARYDRYVRELELLEKKRVRKIKQILALRKKLGFDKEDGKQEL